MKKGLSNIALILFILFANLSNTTLKKDNATKEPDNYFFINPTHVCSGDSAIVEPSYTTGLYDNQSSLKYHFYTEDPNQGGMLLHTGRNYKFDVSHTQETSLYVYAEFQGELTSKGITANIYNHSKRKTPCNKPLSIALSECDDPVSMEKILGDDYFAGDILSVYHPITDKPIKDNLISYDLINGALTYELTTACNVRCSGILKTVYKAYPDLKIPCQDYNLSSDISGNFTFSKNGLQTIVVGKTCEKDSDSKFISHSLLSRQDVGQLTQKKYYCVTDSSFWCQYQATFMHLFVNATNGDINLIYNIENLPLDSTITVEYDLSTPECFNCITWCSDDTKYIEIETDKLQPILTKEQIIDSIELLCFPELVEIKIDTLIRKNACKGFEIFQWYGIFSRPHGITKVLLTEQAYASYPIDIAANDDPSKLDNNKLRIADNLLLDCSDQKSQSIDSIGFAEYFNQYKIQNGECHSIEFKYQVITEVKAESIYNSDTEDWGTVETLRKKLHVETFCGQQDLDKVRKLLFREKTYTSNRGYSVGDIYVVYKGVDLTTGEFVDNKDFLKEDFNWPKESETRGAYDTLTTGVFCNIKSNYTDVNGDLNCLGVAKKIRQWEFFDWCSGLSYKYLQLIEIKDTSPPIVTKHPILHDTITLSTNMNDCHVDLKQLESLVEFHDDCSTINLSLEVLGSFSTTVTKGIYTLRYKAIDACDNESHFDIPIKVYDGMSPSVNCSNGTTISLTYDPITMLGTAKLLAESLDQGTHDFGCSGYTLKLVREDDWKIPVRNCEDQIIGYEPQSCSAKIKRFDIGQKDEYGYCQIPGKNTVNITQPHDFISFCCEDVGQTINAIMFYNDDQSNQNICRVPVTIRDATIPKCVINDININECDFDLKNFNKENNWPDIVGYACDYSSLYSFDSPRKIHCGKGGFTRYYYFDKNDNQSYDENEDNIGCIQNFIINYDVTFDPNKIMWPVHYNGENYKGFYLECSSESNYHMTDTTLRMPPSFECIEETILDKPMWCDTSCDLVTMDVKIRTIESDDFCQKLIKTWTVIDWCIYDPNAQNNIPNNFEVYEDTRSKDCRNCITDSLKSPKLYFKYKDVENTGLYVFNQEIYIVDKSKPSFTLDHNYVVGIQEDLRNKEEHNSDQSTCEESGKIELTGIDYCLNINTSADLKWLLTWSKYGQTFHQDEYNGTHIIVNTPRGKTGETFQLQVTLRDKCGNQLSKRTEVNFIDIKPPTPICLASISITIDDYSDQYVEVKASDFDMGSYDDCSDIVQTIVHYRDQPIYYGKAGFEDQQIISYDCDFLKNSSVDDVKIYTWDTMGNYDYCRAKILFNTSNNISCNNSSSGNSEATTPIISGRIMDINKNMLENVRMFLQTDFLTFESITNNYGKYSFNKFPIGANFYLSAKKDVTEVSQITTYDLVLIQKHLLGIKNFDTYYSYIAADINKDGKVTNLDVLLLRKYLLKIKNFNDVVSWIFLPLKNLVKETDLEYATKGMPQYLLNVSSNLQNSLNIGILKGDVSAMRPNKKNSISLKAIIKQSNNLQTIRIKLPNTKILGLQTGFNIATNKISSIYIDQLVVDPKYYYVDQYGALALSIDFKGLSKQVHELSINLVGNEPIQFYNSSSPFSSEYYTENGQSISFSILESTKIKNDRFYQNAPNPFTQFTSINFELMQSSKITLEIYDIQGQIIYYKDQHYPIGPHSIRIGSEILSKTNNPSVLLYRISSFNQSKVFKMLKAPE